MPYLGIDPGDLTGIALITDDGDVCYFKNAKPEEVMEFLNRVDVKIYRIIMESFIVYRHKASKQTGSKMVASQVIGIVKFWAKQHNIPITEQQANVLGMAEKQSRLHPTGAHKYMHWMDAANHALYYMYKNHIVPTPLEKEIRNGQHS